MSGYANYIAREHCELCHPGSPIEGRTPKEICRHGQKTFEGKATFEKEKMGEQRSRINEDHRQRMIRFLDKQADLVHPDYGSCDGFADGYCSACERRITGLRQRERVIYNQVHEHLDGEAESRARAVEPLREYIDAHGLAKPDKDGNYFNTALRVLKEQADKIAET